MADGTAGVLGGGCRNRYDGGCAFRTGEFLGGIITPGFDLMRKSLAGNTAVSNEDEGEFCDYPDSTADAAYSGATHALAGAVERMAILLAKTLGHLPICILAAAGLSGCNSSLT